MTKEPELSAEPQEAATDETKATLWEHLAELKLRLMICVAAFLLAFGLCYAYAEEIYQFLLRPLVKYYGADPNHRLIYTGLAEAFFTYVKLAMFSAFVLTFPVWSMQLYRFIAPGLYKHERRVFLPYLALAPLLFLIGAAMAYYVIFPLAWQFFLSFETTAGVPIELEARVSEYLSLVTQLIVAFGLAFQLPIVLTLLVRSELLTVTTLKQKRRYAILITFLLAAMLTPPDIISQIGLAIPLLLLYECSILSGSLIEKKKKQKQSEDVKEEEHA